MNEKKCCKIIKYVSKHERDWLSAVSYTSFSILNSVVSVECARLYAD